MSGYYLAVAVLAALNLTSIALSLLMWMRLQRLEMQLQGVPAAIVPFTAPSAPPAPLVTTPDKFSTALMGGEMNLRAKDMREPPEKYRFVGSLAEQGMDAPEIAKALHLSLGEVEQILTLGRLGRRDAPPATEAKESDDAGRKG